MYEYLVMDLILAVFWFILYFLRNDLRKVMVLSSLLCLPLGLSDFIFIPWYWNPQTLFNLRPGIESFIFAFLIGGCVSVLYKVLFKKKIKKLKKTKNKKHFFILFGVLLASMVFLSFIFKMNLIYTGIISMVLGALVICLLRKDLIKESLYGGLLFLVLYIMVVLFVFVVIFPGAIGRILNHEHVLGIFVLGIQVEEYFWAFTFGALWSPLYQFLKGYFS
ncbi:lycopene cyclase domain-containing protein [Nanoarchaeota archaeon]